MNNEQNQEYLRVIELETSEAHILTPKPIDLNKINTQNLKEHLS